MQACKPVCLAANITDLAWLWHARRGHVNFHALKMMVEKQMVHSLPKLDHPTQLCEGCLATKQARLSFPVQAICRAEHPLQLVHTDLCGPIAPHTLAGNKYFFLLVDDYSRMMWVYMLKSKDQALGAFKKFKALAKNETEKKLKILVTDHGGEFTSWEFEALCERCRILCNKTE